MIIKEVEPYDNDDKKVKVISYCCQEMKNDMKEYRYWEIFNGELSCGDMECGIGGKYCSHCGDRITILK